MTTRLILRTMLWVIYDHPKDFPKHYVCRRWRMLEGGLIPDGRCRKAATLEEIRATLPAGLMRLDRHELDDTAILEVWL